MCLTGRWDFNAAAPPLQVRRARGEQQRRRGRQEEEGVLGSVQEADEHAEGKSQSAQKTVLGPLAKQHGIVLVAHLRASCWQREGLRPAEVGLPAVNGSHVFRGTGHSTEVDGFLVRVPKSSLFTALLQFRNVTGGT